MQRAVGSSREGGKLTFAALDIGLGPARESGHGVLASNAASATLKVVKDDGELRDLEKRPEAKFGISLAYIKVAANSSASTLFKKWVVSQSTGIGR